MMWISTGGGGFVSDGGGGGVEGEVDGVRKALFFGLSKLFVELAEFPWMLLFMGYRTPRALIIDSTLRTVVSTGCYTYQA